MKKIKGLIEGLNMQQWEIYTKQKMVDLTTEDGIAASSIKLSWDVLTKLEFPKFNREEFDS